MQGLASTRQVIAVEMQGHGRTANTDRPLSFATMGDDIAAPVDFLRIPNAGAEGHEPGRRIDGQTHDADADGQALSTMVRAAALPDVPRQDGEVDERGL